MIKQCFRSLRGFRSFAGDAAGGIAIEFAFVFPLLAMMMFGFAGMYDHNLLKHKATIAVDTSVDLLSRSIEVTHFEKNNIFEASNLMLGRYANRVTLKMILTGIEYDEDQDAMRVVWSRGCGVLPPYQSDQVITLAEMPSLDDGGMLVMVEYRFEYLSPLYFITGDKIMFKGMAVRKPRYTNIVKYVPKDSTDTRSNTNCEST